MVSRRHSITKKERRNLSPLFSQYISLRFFLFNIISLRVCQIRIIFTYLYIIPLVLRSFIVNFFKTAAVIERSISYARYAIRYRYACKSAATTERTSPYARYAVSDCYARKSAAIGERFPAYTRYAIANRYACKSAAIGERTFV